MIARIQHDISRFAFPISVNRKRFELKHWKQWKASELRTFFFYMVIPLLKEYLRPKYFWNLCTLVFGKIKRLQKKHSFFVVLF